MNQYLYHESIRSNQHNDDYNINSTLFNIYSEARAYRVPLCRVTWHYVLDARVSFSTFIFKILIKFSKFWGNSFYSFVNNRLLFLCNKYKSHVTTVTHKNINKNSFCSFANGSNLVLRQAAQLSNYLLFRTPLGRRLVLHDHMAYFWQFWDIFSVISKFNFNLSFIPRRALDAHRPISIIQRNQCNEYRNNTAAAPEKLLEPQ